MTTITGIAGSLRTGSYNAALLRAAAHMMPAGARLDIASIQGIPLYDGDVETREGAPAAVTALKERIVAGDGLLLVTPEYNHSIPGVLKNAIDWLSRPPSDSPRVFGGRPVALIGASMGGFGTVLAQNAWLPVLRALGMRPWFGARLLVSNAARVFDERGEIIDDRIREQLAQFMRGFAEFAGS